MLFYKFIRYINSIVVYSLISVNLYADHLPSGGARPVYVFVHRANDVPPNEDNDIQEAIDGGGNAIEFDLYACDSSRSGWIVHHDHCGGMGRSTIDQWLTAYQGVRSRGQIRAIAFDIKAPAPVPKSKMRSLVMQARAAIPNDVLIIYGVGEWNNRTNLIPIMQDLRDNEVITIDDSDQTRGFADRVISFFESHSVINQVFADGRSAAGKTGSAVRSNLRNAVSIRDTTNLTKLVYSWTYERESSIEEMLLDLRLDGVFVNDCVVFCTDHFDPFKDGGLDNALDVVQDNTSTLRFANAGDLKHWGLSSLQPAVMNAAVGLLILM